MSHWTKVATKITDREVLKSALKRLGWEFEEGNFSVSQYGTTEKAELLLSRDNHNKENGAVGLSQQADGTWAMVGDPYHCPYGHKLSKYYRQEKQFTADLQTAYAVEEAKKKLSDQSYYCTENTNAEVGKDGMITMVFESVY